MELPHSDVGRPCARNQNGEMWRTPCRMSREFLLPALFLLILFCGEMQAQNTTIIGVTQLRLTEPALIGTGVSVAQPEAAIGNAWQVSPAATGQPVSLFIYQTSAGTATTFPNAVGEESGHADLVGDIFYGKTNAATPEGVAPGVAKVYSYDANFFYGSRIATLTSISAKVVNQSFIYGGQNTTVDQRYDLYAATYNTVFVSGVGNGGAPNSPATSFNNIGVGAYGGSSSVGPTTDGRCKPDISAPAGETSYATPLVAGAATLLVQAALRGDGGTPTADAADLRTIKALLLNGTNKPSDWRHTPTVPLDLRHGAGVVNVLRSHDQLKGGKHAPGGTFTTAASLRGWAKTAITGNPLAVHHYTFTLSPSLGSHYDVSATLVWNRNANETAIKNLDLALYDTATGAPVLDGVSTSAVDNVEHLWRLALPPGTYELRVIKNATSGLLVPDETYALAFRFTPQAPPGVRITKFPQGADPQVTFVAPGGLAFRIEAKYAADDAVTPWITVASGTTHASGTTVISDPATLGQQGRFYRVVLSYP